MMFAMCGRYATSRTSAQLQRDFEAGLSDLYEETGADYNVAPTVRAPALIGRVDRDSSTMRREIVTARWGLIPSWARDPSIGGRLINARAETVGEKPAFRRAFAQRRAVIPADGFYEWYQPTDRGARKQPFYLTGRGGEPLALAGLYEFRRDPQRGWTLSYAILTTSADGEDGRIHDRAPLLVPRRLTDVWLDPRHDGRRTLAQLQPATPGALDLWPVSTAVNNVRHNGPELVRPLPAE